MDALLDQAYIQTGNFEDTVKYDVTDDYKRFRPGGRIRLFDKRLNQLIGFEGVRVEARRWFTVHTARPNYEGYYRMSHGFDRACNYSAWFATGSFSVHEKLYGLTNWINGPKKRVIGIMKFWVCTTVLLVMFLEVLTAIFTKIFQD